MATRVWLDTCKSRTIPASLSAPVLHALTGWLRVEEFDEAFTDWHVCNSYHLVLFVGWLQVRGETLVPIWQANRKGECKYEVKLRVQAHARHVQII